MKTTITLAAAFLATIIGANWALNQYGFVSIGFGMTAPAGVYFAGLAFGLRDAIQERGGRWWVGACIVAGAIVSYAIEPRFALASALAFGLSEFADLAVYTPLRERNWAMAVAASNAVGAITDSLLFLVVAFGTTTGWVDLTIGKLFMIVPALLIVRTVRR